MSIINKTRVIITFCLVMFSFSVFADNLIKTEHTIKSGDSLISILKKNYIKGDDIHSLIYKTKDSKKIQNLKVGQDLTIYKKNDGSLKKLILDADNINAYIATETAPNKFTIKKGKFKTTQINRYAVGKVKYSVGRTLKEMNLSKSQIKEFQNMFGGKIDFKKIKKGSTFVAVYPEYYNGKQKVSTGSLLSAEISYGNSSKQVFTFDDYQGNKSYYLKNGEPTSEGIQRDPLETYIRVSSEFHKARKHPVLGYVRAHNGTDYAAKRGTPILAAASGKVALKDSQKGYGNVIVINHEDGYSTLYAHMHNFKKGIYSGKKVSKGDVIGYVGSTGISTGNHLHFEIRKDGKHLDPRKVNLPSGSKISKKDVTKFKRITKKHSDGINLAKILNVKEGKTSIAIRNKP